jgi:hypothetical protein
MEFGMELNRARMEWNGKELEWNMEWKEIGMELRMEWNEIEKRNVKTDLTKSNT